MLTTKARNKQGGKQKPVCKVIGQKEYLFVDPKHAAFVGTESIRGCYAIAFFHPKKSGMIHFDDNTKQTELARVIEDYLGGNLDPSDCNVSVIGGWQDHQESKQNGDFVVNCLRAKGFNVCDTLFQKKSQQGSSEATGFYYAVLNCRTGEILSSDTHKMNDFIIEQGTDKEARIRAKNYMDMIQCATEGFPDSGSVLIHRDSYRQKAESQLIELCNTAKANNKAGLLEILDRLIIDLNIAPKQAKGWNALHYACRVGAFECALLLVQNGAKLYQKNDLNKAPIDYTEGRMSPDEIQRLKTISMLIQLQLAARPQHGLRAMAVYSRHPEECDEHMREHISSILEMPTPMLYQKLSAQSSNQRAQTSTTMKKTHSRVAM